jgi:hypothetical protein
LGRFPSSSWSSHTPSWPSPPRGMAQQHICCYRGCRPTWDACGSGAAIRHCAIVGTVQEPKVLRSLICLHAPELFEEMWP